MPNITHFSLCQLISVRFFYSVIWYALAFNNERSHFFLLMSFNHLSRIFKSDNPFPPVHVNNCNYQQSWHTS